MTERGSVRVFESACVCHFGIRSNLLSCMFTASFGSNLRLLYAGFCCKVLGRKVQPEVLFGS